MSCLQRCGSQVCPHSRKRAELSASTQLCTPQGFPWICQGSGSPQHSDRRGGRGRILPRSSQVTQTRQRGWGMAAGGWLSPQVRMGRTRDLAGKRKCCPLASLELPGTGRALLCHQLSPGSALMAVAEGRRTCSVPTACVWDRLSTGCTLLRPANIPKPYPSSFSTKVFHMLGNFQLAAHPAVGGI